MTVDPVLGALTQSSIRAYDDLVSAATRLYGEVVTTGNPKTSREYWMQAKAGASAELALDEPHVAAFRIRSQGYAPVACTTASSSMSAVVLRNSYFRRLEDLRPDVPVGTLPAPSLSQAILVDAIGDPLHEPDIHSGFSSYTDLLAALRSLRVSAVVVPTELTRGQTDLREIYTSKPFPTAVLSAIPGARIPSEGIRSESVRECSKEELAPFEKLLRRFAL